MITMSYVSNSHACQVIIMVMTHIYSYIIPIIYLYVATIIRQYIDNHNHTCMTVAWRMAVLWSIYMRAKLFRHYTYIALDIQFKYIFEVFFPCGIIKEIETKVSSYMRHGKWHDGQCIVSSLHETWQMA